MRHTALGLRLVILTTFALFFVVPLIWLILAPTKSDAALVTSSPLSFGNFHHVLLAWRHLNAFSDHIYRRWIGNSLFYALSATGITLVAGVPAGYGLAFGDFPGRKLILSLTLIVMIIPGAALVLPIFLELNSLHLIGRAGSVIPELLPGNPRFVSTFTKTFSFYAAEEHAFFGKAWIDSIQTLKGEQQKAGDKQHDEAEPHLKREEWAQDANTHGRFQRAGIQGLIR